jgi:hypothetical protein
VRAVPPGHPERADADAAMLLTRFRSLRDDADLAAAVEAAQAAVDATPSERPAYSPTR